MHNIKLYARFSPHPYLFFNSDRGTFTFLGFYIDKRTGNLIDQQSGTILEQRIMQQNLYDGLHRNFVPIQENFDNLPRDEKITRMCKVIGMDMPYDPDSTYELTTDNVKKILAIFMRFRCDIPVIIMGETGCGKTRLVKFMCSLQAPPGVDVTNMILMKVHGGTTNADIIKKVHDAEEIAQQNVKKYGKHMFTVLFFDEANTTEAIGLIKEIMCDKTMEGRPLKLCDNLKMIAACNPYRRHSEELIKRLEQAGLGYHVDAENTTDKLGRVPMRRLVYRVQPLPQSLLPLVWDFGQLDARAENLYIRQMVTRYINNQKLPRLANMVEVVSAVLTASQDYMRQQKDECSFVSLRDVERVLSVMSWFYQQSCENGTLYRRMDGLLYGATLGEEEEEEEEEEEDVVELLDGGIDKVTRSLVLAVGVCYHACLKTRDGYRAHVARHFRAPCQLHGGPDQIEQEILCCQDVFLSNVPLEKNIAKNMALKENLFMMVVCIELRIPLFLVGKPGSSKSLAKTIVSDAMQGNAAHTQLFKELKQAQMVSFQCSPLSTPNGIVATFRQCAQFQKDKDLDTFVSIVVLDEVGLAEDSPRMPLKTLHPLLEDGCQGDEKPEPYRKVAFIGISNWALDPAKMNRGILVQREVPDLQELISSASGICTIQDNIPVAMKKLMEPMAKSYLDIFKSATKREFYGLRDFYSLVKMVFAFAERSKRCPSWHEMEHAVMRNFGGLYGVDPVEKVKSHLKSILPINEKSLPTDPDCSPVGLIKACLFDTALMDSESRYLLLLTENYGALTILQQILQQQTDIRPITIFGSSFPKDQEYTQVCRNINKIKVCMETGKTVVLLNLENLYESLYDALNQYYVYFGGERYVDLGLGTHRVKCRVHKQFRLIVVAEKEAVYTKFPTPLINRLEKHFLTINTMLTPEQRQLADTLEQWANEFAKQKPSFSNAKARQQKPEDVFMGYHADTCASIVLHEWNGDRNPEEVLSAAKHLLLWCATPDSVVRLKLSRLPDIEQLQLQNDYFKAQEHGSIRQYLRFKLVAHNCGELFAQVTTHSKLLSAADKAVLSKETGISQRNIMLETLQSFDTEQQFSNKIKSHLQVVDNKAKLLIVQCDSGDTNASLVACARYSVLELYQTALGGHRSPVHIVFIIQLPRVAGGCFTGFQCGKWHSVHIDELHEAAQSLPHFQEMQTKSVATLVNQAVAMETEDYDIHVDYPEPMEPLEQDMDWECGRQEETGTSDAMPGSTIASATNTIQLKDIVYTLGHPPNHGAVRPDSRYEEPPGPRLDVPGLILSCVQKALAKVKDEKGSKERTTERVGLLLTLLNQTEQHGELSFMQGISKLAVSLLKDKEEKSMNVDMANDWLVQEASKPDNIQKAGTFRRACVQYLESKLATILAEIIAYTDTNCNLDLLKHDVLPWKQQMWLQMLDSPDAMQLKYESLQSITRQNDQVKVMTTGSEGQPFAASLPFSWLIYNQIKDLVNRTQPDIEDHEEEGRQDVELVVRVFGETALGRIVQMIERTCVEGFQQAYLSDFVHMEYSSQSHPEHQLVCQSIEYLAQCQTDMHAESAQHFIVAVHLAHAELAPRLGYFRTMNQVWPECSSTIWKLRTTDPDHYMFQEREFTFSSLCLLIESLSPTQTQLDEVAGRSRWLDRVYKYRPVVEVINLCIEDPGKYGSHSHRSVMHAKCLWTRVVAMKLFLEHVSAFETGRSKITVKRCMPFWKLLGDEANLKEVRSLDAVERFLKLCNQTAVKEYLGKQQTCCHCENRLEGPPIMLPCKDLICEACYLDIGAQGPQVCPKCNAEIPANYSPEAPTENSQNIEKLKDFQKRCNTFFMDLVAQLCFADHSPPTDGVIDKLLGYITQTGVGKATRLTKEMTIFSSGLDPNPVFRSFLLQLLMRTSEERVEVNLEKYLHQAEDLLDQHPAPQTTGQHPDPQATNQTYTELCLMVIQCLEDLFHQELGDSEVQITTTWIRQAIPAIKVDDTNVEKLYGLAKARAGLFVCAKYVSQIVINEAHRVPAEICKLIAAAKKLCEGPSVWPKRYLVKCLCRSYGVDVYQKVCLSRDPNIRWMNLQEYDRNQVVEGPDRYVICGDAYSTIRESLTRVILGESVDKLQETITGLETAGGHVEVMLRLAIHREIACSNVYSENRTKVSPKTIEVIRTFSESSKSVKDKAFVAELLHNQLGGHLTVLEGEDLRVQGLQCLVLHALTVLKQIDGGQSLLQPLTGLYKEPQKYAHAYLPTMPEDNVAEIREALLQGRDQVGGENPFMYQCPKGHPYVIGDCGRPTTRARCPDCGANIGGVSHQPDPGNVKYDGFDKTKTGHILGRAQFRGQVVAGERSLSPSATVCLRLLTHIAMYLGTKTNKQAIWTIIQPQLQPGDVADFLWHHIEQDIGSLMTRLGKSVDDVLLLLHYLLHTMLVQYKPGGQAGNNIGLLTTKADRAQWERLFVQTHVNPALENLDDILNAVQQRLLNDNRLGADPLLGMMYEIDVPHDPVALDMLQELPSVWRFRSRISMESLRHEFDTKLGADASRKGTKHVILRGFLQQECHLRALRYVPGILKLQRLLLQRYQRRLDRAEAADKTIGQLKHDEDVGSLLEEFGACWELVRQSLENHVVVTETGRTMVPKEYCRQQITDDTPISWLLPTTRHTGLCSFALLDFLFRKQNEFLEMYLNKTKRKIGTVKASEVTLAHLVSYEPRRDVLPLVLANCQYSFEIGKGTSLEYDFSSLEQQIIDRFLYSKSKIDTESILAIDQMVYRAESTNSAIFKKLGDKIPQERLSGAMKRQISEELHSLPDICQSLDSLDISISFLTSVGGHPEHRLLDFMEKTLRMGSPLCSQKAGQVCLFKHTQSLWMLLTLSRTQKLADHHQDRHAMFDSLSEEFHENLPVGVATALHNYLWNLSINKLPSLVEMLHEYIVIIISVPTNMDDDDYMDTTNNQLHAGLWAYVDNEDLDCSFLDNFPGEILHRHAIHTWLMAYDVLKKKRSGQQYSLDE